MCVCSRLKACSSTAGSSGCSMLPVPTLCLTRSNITWLISGKERRLCKADSVGSTDSRCQVEVRFRQRDFQCSGFFVGLQTGLVLCSWASLGRKVDVLEGGGRISSVFVPAGLYHSVNSWGACLSEQCLLSHVLFLRLWPTFLACFPPAWPLPPFAPSKAVALRLVVRLASTAFYFGLYLLVWRGGCSWAESWERRRRAWASGLSATCDVLSRPAALGPARGGKGGGSAEAARPLSAAAQLRSRKWPGREFAPACAAPGTAAVPAWASAGLKMWWSVSFGDSTVALLHGGLSRAVSCVCGRGQWPADKSEKGCRPVWLFFFPKDVGERKPSSRPVALRGTVFFCCFPLEGNWHALVSLVLHAENLALARAEAKPPLPGHWLRVEEMWTCASSSHAGASLRRGKTRTRYRTQRNWRLPSNSTMKEAENKHTPVAYVTVAYREEHKK